MWTFPVLLDCRPAFLSRARGGSLLLAPLGDGTVLSHLRARVSVVTSAPPVIGSGFEVDSSYEEAIRAVCPDVETVETLPCFAERLYTYEPSDRLLLMDPTCFLLDAGDPALSWLNERDDPRCVRHLVAVEKKDEGPKEYVDADASGRIRSIQRYYDSVTWPFAAGVACSLVPVACLRVACELPLASLPRLRRVLAAEGVPSRDLPLERGAINLNAERGLLAMNERMVHALSGGASAPTRDGLHSVLLAGPRTKVHPSASVVGPVVLQEGAQIAECVTLIGPAVVGRGSRIEAGATIAQSVIGAGQVVAGGQAVRHRVILGAANGSAPTGLVASEVTRDASSAEAWETPPFGLALEARRRSVYPSVKRAIDACVAAVGLAFLSPLSLLIAASIKLESRGPVHFGHPREGMGGRPFRCWKFRTMVPEADAQQRKLSTLNQMDGPQFKVDQDPRRTRVGRFLTATNLDEVPQLWNVLVGEMSLVGPRPSPFRENQVCVPWREGRLSIRPGITGLWQVCRHDRHKGDFHQWIYYDLLYVRNMSFWLDTKIAALTLVSFVKGGYIPLSWLLRPERYGERRAAPRRDQGPRSDWSESGGNPGAAP